MMSALKDIRAIVAQEHGINPNNKLLQGAFDRRVRELVQMAFIGDMSYLESLHRVASKEEQQADYIGVAVEGPFKADRYRY